MADSDRQRLLAYGALGLGVLSLGLAPIFVRWADAPGPVTSFYRLAIVAVLLAVPFFRRAKVRGGLPRQGVLLALLGGLFFAGDLGFWSSGVMLSGATNPTLMLNTAPLWVGLGAMLLFRERLGPLFWFGLILAVTGAMTILGLDRAHSVTLGLGTSLGLVGGIFHAAYFMTTQLGRKSLDSLSYFWLATCTSAIGLLVTSLVLRQPLTGYPPQAYLSFLALALVSQILGHFSINYALGYLPASLVAPTLLGQPVVAAILAGPLLGEHLTIWQILGGMAVLAGVLAVHRSQREQRLSQRHVAS
ncbi:MAG: DMT family transporter [Chloroflexota bacterium]